MTETNFNLQEFENELEKKLESFNGGEKGLSANKITQEVANTVIQNPEKGFEIISVATAKILKLSSLELKDKIRDEVLQLLFEKNKELSFENGVLRLLVRLL